MAIRKQTLERLSTEHLIHHLRLHPNCHDTKVLLLDRGEGKAVFDIIKHDQEERLLQRLSTGALTEEATKLMLEVARGSADCSADISMIGIT